jgi:hypothetical protein
VQGGILSLEHVQGAMENLSLGPAAAGAASEAPGGASLSTTPVHAWHGF